ncbi:ATP-binding protein [Runella sp. SP2]|uniref:hybrid sensor histidine kinase/response regulator transcription factor n=1 Tax=Runella sp. SP2 TaxID=2268026 RepID=UPI000F08AFC5|nr:ATP-binding protein [Runella sp. SP2]AYQ33209.1 response regulator [Runella sp. SP2]
MKFFIRIVIVLLLPTHLQAQGWQPIGLSEGLSQGMVYDLAQDQRGFMWVATKDGLNRYDGYNFKVFTHDPYNPYSISSNTCTALLYDSHDRLWIGTEKDGLNLFDPVYQRFYRISIASPNQPSTGNYNIVQLEEDTQGNIWIMTDQPTVHFKINIPPRFTVSEQATKQLNIGSLGPSYFPPISRHQHSGLHGAWGQNLCGFLDKWIGNKSRNRDFYILPDHQKNYWVMLDHELICWRNGIKKTIHVAEGDYKKIGHLKDGTIAICNQNFLWLMKPEELLQQDSLTAKNKYSTVPDQKRVNTIRMDNLGNIWLGTRGYGLYKFNPRIKQFKAYLPDFSPSYLLQDSQKRIYFHGNAKPAYQYYQLESPTSFKPFSPDVAAARYNHDFLYQDRKQQFWLMAREDSSRYLFQLSNERKLLARYPLPMPYTDRHLSVRMLEDKKGRLWLGLVDGVLLRFDPLAGQFKKFSYQSLLPQQGSTIEVLYMYEDTPDVYWICTQKGLIKVENILENPRFSLFKNNADDRNSLSNDVVSGCVNDPIQPTNYLWVSTKGGGLERLNKATNQFEHFTEKRGLPNKVVYGVLVGDDKNLWMGTNRGLAQLNPKTLIFSNFNKSDGLQDDEFNTNSYFKGASGELLFGGINGFNVFRASNIARAASKAEVRLLSLKINNQLIEVGDETQLLSEAIEYLPSLELAHHQNQLAIEFGVMDFTNPVKNRFRYQLEGIDKDWVEAGTTHIANFAQLPSGHYTLKVMGTTDGENWTKPISLAIQINPPFYRTWWAYLLYLTIVAYVAYRWNQNQLNRVRLQEQLSFKEIEAGRMSELDALKTNFFANISHEFRTPLTLILGPVEQLLKDHPSDGRLPLVRRHAQRLLELINQLLDISKLEAGQMLPELTHLEVVRYLRTLTSSFTSLAESRQINFVVTQNQDEAWGYLDTDKTEKIITNLLSNAFKFTETGGTVKVDVQYTSPVEGQGVIIAISDTGIGIKPEKLPQIFNRFYQVESDQKRSYEGTGIGLALVKELVEVMKGSIQVESKVGVGSQFVVRLPIDELTWKSHPKIPEKVFGPKKVQLEPHPILLPTPVEETSNENVLLLIDDNADIRSYIRGLFEPDYRIIEAQDGEEGLVQAMAHIPNIIISDLMMPRMDGFEFCRQLKSNEKTSHIPVIMLTAKANVESRIEGFQLGADDYLVKPFHTDEIRVRVKNLLEKQEKLRAYFSGKQKVAKSETAVINPLDVAFVEKAKKIVEQHLGSSTFNAEQFSSAMNLSQSQLLRKLKALTNFTIVEFIRHHRLQRAAEMLLQRNRPVSEIALEVGFENMSYFAKVFQDEFGVLPSDYQG